MSRWVKIAAAQMGPNNESASRSEIVSRLLALLEQAIHGGRAGRRAHRPRLDPPARERWNCYARRHLQHYGVLTEPVRAEEIKSSHR
jgi:hypothetical protein